LLDRYSDVDADNLVYVKGSLKAYTLKLSKGVTGCRVYIGEGSFGKGNRIILDYSNSTVFISDYCNLKNVNLRGGNIFVGRRVSSHAGHWLSGVHQRQRLDNSPDTAPIIVIGDGCMFSREITIRTSDAHPIFQMQGMDIVNDKGGSVFIEPHVWVCEKASIMKGVRIGACSIVALGSIVTKDVPKNHSASGVPAQSVALNGKLWAMNTTTKAMNQAKKFYEEYVVQPKECK